MALARLQIQYLKGQLRLAPIKKYGPGSEKLSGAQLNLLGLEPGVSNVEVQAESVREPLLEPAKGQKRRKHPGRQELPASGLDYHGRPSRHRSRSLRVGTGGIGNPAGWFRGDEASKDTRAVKRVEAGGDGPA